MSYEANYNTALTYIRSGLMDRALESLHTALVGIPNNEKNKDNVIYLRILTLLARVGLEKGNRHEAIDYIDQGLNIMEDHADLLFLKSLYFCDDKRYDEMAGTIVAYLVSLVTSDVSRYDYEFTGESAVREVFERLIPISYKRAVAHKEILGIVRRLSEKTDNGLIKQAYSIMVEIDKKRETGNG